MTALPDLLNKQLIIVSGKGGVGKTVVSSALGLIASGQGKTVLLVKMDDQGRTAQLFESGPVTDRISPLRENISAINLDPKTIVADYFQRQLKIKRLVKHIVDSKLFESWFRVSPAIKEMVCLGKVQDLVQEASWWRSKRTWDLVIFDAPATGHGLGLLRLPHQASKLLIGGMRKSALEVQALLQNHKSTSLVLVTIPEEMPVSETVHFFDGAEAIDMPLGCVVLNGAAPRRFAEGDPGKVEALLDDPQTDKVLQSLLGESPSPQVRAGLHHAATRGRARQELTEYYTGVLEEKVRLPRLEIPHVYTDSFGYSDLERVAAHLERALAGAGFVKNEALDTILREKRVVICCGSGGVGKTTTSASLALRATLLGRRAVVCTIDPARRLANSMGITELGNEVIEVDRALYESLDAEPKGALFAMMLDTKRTFDKLIGRYAVSDEARERILGNKFYQQMSSTVVGSSDYMAMEKLFELHESGDYDLIVLDTPPTKHALDFLQAPQRMTDAFDESTLSVFLKPWAEAGKRSLGFLGRALNRVIKKVDDVLGLDFVSDIADFFRAFDGMYEGFRGRAEKVNALLREAHTSFLVVTSPNPLALQEASFFCEKLREFDMPLDGVIVNRVNPSAVGSEAVRSALHAKLREQGPEAVTREALASAAAPALLEAVLQSFLELELQAAGDRGRIESLRAGPAKGVPVAEVPQLSTDVHDLSGLRLILDCLFEGSPA